MARHSSPASRNHNEWSPGLQATVEMGLQGGLQTLWNYGLFDETALESSIFHNTIKRFRCVKILMSKHSFWLMLVVFDKTRMGSIKAIIGFGRHACTCDTSLIIVFKFGKSVIMASEVIDWALTWNVAVFWAHLCDGEMHTCPNKGAPSLRMD